MDNNATSSDCVTREIFKSEKLDAMRSDQSPPNKDLSPSTTACQDTKVIHSNSPSGVLNPCNPTVESESDGISTGVAAARHPRSNKTKIEEQALTIQALRTHINLLLAESERLKQELEKERREKLRLRTLNEQLAGELVDLGVGELAVGGNDDLEGAFEEEGEGGVGTSQFADRAQLAFELI